MYVWDSSRLHEKMPASRASSGCHCPKSVLPSNHGIRFTCAYWYSVAMLSVAVFLVLKTQEGSRGLLRSFPIAI